MRGDVDTVKERLDITEVVSGYVKLEKAGTSLKARCPFHNEKTPSFFVSPARQSFYCFGCGAKGDIFSFVEAMEGLDFRGALKLLAAKAGVEIEYQRDESKTEKNKILGVLEEATIFFEKELAKSGPARHYISARGISDETMKNWRLGYAPAEWRSLYGYLGNLGHDKEIMLKAGLIKVSNAGGEPYDVFRDRIIFPLADQNGQVIAFSGRALTWKSDFQAEVGLPKYLNSPDTILFTKGELLYGLDKAKDQIRKQDYAVLVEGQMDLVLSHQAGVSNTVAASGTAFTRAHLERLKRLSARIILAFDGDVAGEKASERASALGLALGLEVKVANLPAGLDPAEVARRNPREWREILRQSLPAVEFFLRRIEAQEKDPRKFGKQIGRRILPMIKLIASAIEQAHFVSMIAKRTSIKEEILWEDLRKIKRADISPGSDPGDQGRTSEIELEKVSLPSQRAQIEERLAEIRLWQKELPASSPELMALAREEMELSDNLSGFMMRDNLNELLALLSQAELSKDVGVSLRLTRQIQELHSQMRALEEKKKML